MTDANSQFFAILTNVGKAKQANADALGIPWKITDMGVGDANNIDPVVPVETQTKLINEWRRRPLNQLKIDPVNPAVLVAEQIIPADEGGKWIREIGLYDADGDLVAVASCAPSFKPLLSQGSGRTQIVRMNFVFGSTGNVTLKIDPAVVLATREYVDQKILEELYKLDNKQSVRVATTGNITLAGIQTLDGVALVAGDRVLVKNQASPKDNGLYTAAAGIWLRAQDADSNAEITSSLLVAVEQGATQADTLWQLVTDGLIVLGATALTFENVTQGFALINSPAFVGTPTAPTASQYNNSKLLATTEFVKKAGSQYSGSTIFSAGPQTLTAAHGGSFIDLTSGYSGSLTLPSITSVPDGTNFYIWSGAAVSFNVLSANGDPIFVSQNAPVTSVTVRPGGTLQITKSGAAGAWVACGGSEQFVFSATYSGLAPKPIGVPGAGAWQSIIAAIGTALILPAGGTWAYFALPFAQAGASQTFTPPASGVAAGGSQVVAAVTGQYWYGFAWRLQ